MLEQVRKLLASLTRRQIVWIAASAVTAVALIGWLVHQNREKDFKPLYSGLAAEDAGQVVARLKESNVEYRLTDNGAAILVPSARVAELRLTLAAAGLPKSGRIGFELFDKTNFGASDFAEHVNYRRALEGELERSVMSIQEVAQARVHLTVPKDSVFADLRRPAKASVLVKLKREASLSAKNVSAIGHLVANAVEGLTPEMVTIVDMQGNLLIPQEKEPKSENREIDSPIEFRQKLESDLLAKLVSTLEPVMGPDHFRAGVSVEVDFTSGEQSEESYDPNRSVMLNQTRSEDVTLPKEANGIPGTPSNLPRPTSRPGSGSGNGVIRRSENITYQSSRLVRRTKLPQGNVRRVSASVVIDQEVRWEGSGDKAKRIVTPPSEETLKKVRDLAAGAIGFQQDRGDQIFVQSLPFESTRKGPPPPDPTASRPGSGLEKWLADKNIQVNPMVLIAGLAVVLIAIAGGVAFLLLRRKKVVVATAAVEVETPPVLPAGTPEDGPAAVAAPEPAEVVPANPSVPDETDDEQKAREAAEKAKAEKDVLKSLRASGAVSKKTEVLIKHIAEESKRDPVMVAQILRSWLNEKERE